MFTEILVVIQYYYGEKNKKNRIERKTFEQRGLLSEYLQEERKYCPDLLTKTN